MNEDIQAVLDFLPCRTPDEWLAQAVDNLLLCQVAGLDADLAQS